MMTKNRLEAFSDGVIAILITIMVLELKVPSQPTFKALFPMLPVLLSYVLSFIYLGIYWNNHHHMFHMAHKVNGKVLWANLHLLFWLSLIPLTTAWMGQSKLAKIPTFAYGFVLFCAGLAYYLLQNTIIASQGTFSKLKSAIGNDIKGKSSVFLYLLSLPLVFIQPLISLAIYIFIALMWLIPDRRIESKLLKK